MSGNNAVPQNAAAQMAAALARWERDGGSIAKAMPGRLACHADPSETESVLADIALRQGMRLERFDRTTATTYRLVPLDWIPTGRETEANFELTLDDAETILMNSNPA